MRQVIHLFIVDRERSVALATRIGSQWLLPVLSCAERVRVAPLVARWSEEHALRADPAGHWLGRVGLDATDWLMIVAASAGRPPPATPLEWTSFDALASGDAVLEYQQWAVARTFARDPRPSVNGPFGNLAWPAHVRAWIAGKAGCSPPALTPYRVSPHEVVLGADCARGRIYFKGLVGERAAEARLTPALAAVAPASFAQTLALEQQDDGSVWWLTGACPGVPGRDAQLIARALAKTQQRVIDTGASRLALPEIGLESAARWASRLLAEATGTAMVTDACARVASADVPRSWIPMDLDPTNVLVDEHGEVRFIDIDDSYFGPAPLAMAAFAQRGGDRTAYRTYEESWSPSLERIDWRSYEIAAAIFQAWLGWNRLKRNVERGEVYAALDRIEVRVRARLGKAVYL